MSKITINNEKNEIKNKNSNNLNIKKSENNKKTKKDPNQVMSSIMLSILNSNDKNANKEKRKIENTEENEIIQKKKKSIIPVGSRCNLIPIFDPNERLYKKYATKGVITLFNAIQKHNEGKKEVKKNVKEATEDGFMEMLKQSAKNENDSDDGDE